MTRTLTMTVETDPDVDVMELAQAMQEALARLQYRLGGSIHVHEHADEPADSVRPALLRRQAL